MCKRLDSAPLNYRRQWREHLSGQVKVLGMDFTHVKCKGEDQIVAVATAILTGEPLDLKYCNRSPRYMLSAGFGILPVWLAQKSWSPMMRMV